MTASAPASDQLGRMAARTRGRRRLAAIGLACAVAVFAVRIWLARVGHLPGDGYFATRLPSPDVPQPIRQLADFFGAVAYPLVAVLTVAAAAWVVRRALDDRRAIGVLLAFGAVAVNTALKTLFGPTQLYADAVGSTESVNFPSGHVAYATALFGFFAFLGLERRRAEVVVVSLLLIVAMGPARIISGAHFPSDVVGGYLVGAAWLCGVVLWTTRR